MEIIEPPALSNSILRNGKVETGGVIGELGVYGVCLWRRVEGAEHARRAEKAMGTKQGKGAEQTKGTEKAKGMDGAYGEGEEVGEEAKRIGKIEILENFEAGYLLRTKGVESEEGGVAAGFGAVDSCLLV